MAETGGLVTINQQLQARINAFRTRKEVLKATYAAARGALRVHEAIAASGLAGDAGGQQEATGETINPAQAALADVTAQMERELGQGSWPEGLKACPRPREHSWGHARVEWADGTVREGWLRLGDCPGLQLGRRPPRRPAACWRARAGQAPALRPPRSAPRWP
jgi:hypothetical protein